MRLYADCEEKLTAVKKTIKAAQPSARNPCLLKLVFALIFKGFFEVK